MISDIGVLIHSGIDLSISLIRRELPFTTDCGESHHREFNGISKYETRKIISTIKRHTNHTPIISG
jgi:hypothetical protein